MRDQEFRDWLEANGANSAAGRNSRVHAVKTIEAKLGELGFSQPDLDSAWAEDRFVALRDEIAAIRQDYDEGGTRFQILMPESERPRNRLSNWRSWLAQYGRFLAGEGGTNSDADLIRQHVLENYIEPAREREGESAELIVKEVNDALGLNQAWPNICQAVRGRKFLELAEVPPPQRFGADMSTATRLLFDLAPTSYWALQTLIKRFGSPLTQTRKIASFEGSDGRQLALDLESAAPQIWLEGNITGALSNFESARHYVPAAPRSSNLPPRLRPGQNDSRDVTLVGFANSDELGAILNVWETSTGSATPSVWLVTSLWGESDGTDGFIERGEWSLLTDTASDNNRRVKEMQVGDRIFLKDYIPRAANLPFDANAGIVTAHRIRAAGTVSEASDDGLRVGVKWDADFEPRIWYFYTNNSAVWRLKDPSENHPSADRLRAFLLEGVDQDYTWFLAQPFWRDRLFGAQTTETGKVMKPTNLVLYGPPGTGKTYRTAKEAVRLCDGEADYGEDAAGRAALMAHYNELVKARQIEFVTFHQNFSYEDFVEGLRPHTDDAGEGKAGFSLKPETGIFKNIADRAGRPVKTGSEEISLDDRRIFKMSLGQANMPQAAWVYEESIQDGFALFGFEDVDWSPEKFADRDAILHELQSRFPDENITVQHGKVKSPDRFRNQLSTGDVIVASKGLNEFRAIGIVEGEYEYAPKTDGRYCHRRKVRWLWEDPDGVAVSELMPDRRFSLDTIYELPKAALNLSVLSRLINSENDEEVEGGETLPHVLIIDEINRANISKVFGELITLIEPDKRLGMANALKVRLPYSKREFGVPANLHIIGTMNTADRSIALLDTALRRRFRFEEIAPEPALLPEQVDGVPLRRVLEVMNERIEYFHDREHRIGHAFFMGDGGMDRRAIDATMRDKVIPLLQEYFFDDWSRIAAVVGEGFIEKRKLPVPPGIEAGEDRLSWNVRSEFAGDAYGILIGKASLRDVPVAQSAQ
ncbi:AAA family ATPase [Qipengyuania flava]|uniref:AAA family ATPase n=1 Tax=Qipengyuania flava TaxID=192812 RepID=UPI003BB17F7E